MNRLRLFGKSLAALAFIALTSCGGGGGGGGSTPPSDPNHVGAGWITITGSDAGSTSSTSAPTVTLSGLAFISPKGSACCTGSASDTGVTVSWVNATTGAPGTAMQTPQYCWLVSTYLCGQTWQATIDLVMGNDVITITATDASGNLGRVTTTVTRTPDVTPPKVSATSPASGATAVGTNSTVTVTFSKAMDPATISIATIQLKNNLSNPVSGGVTYSNGVATFTPAANLQGSTLYTGTITTGVKDVAGIALATAYMWSFTTGAAPDTTPPTVSSTSPANGAACVPTETSLIATFSKPVSSQTVNANTFLLKDSLSNAVGGTVGLDFYGLGHFFPNSPLANLSSYSGTITTGLTDLSGNHLAADYTWTLTTQAAGAGTWNATPTTGAPSPRSAHTTVWTGTQMIVWGGYDRNSLFGDGARYDPATDTWTLISSVGAPSARSGHVAVWTGNKMIIWGGVQPGAFLNSGALYDPVTDTWTSISSSGAPSARAGATAVWSGTEMIVWGGTGSNVSFPTDAARYNPITNSWSAVSVTGAPVARSGHTAIWTGSVMLVWGGSDSSVVFASGGIYTPSSDSWTAITTTGAPAARQFHPAVWTGTEMIIWGGWDGSNPLGTGARYDPSSNTWKSMASVCAPLARFGHIGVWSGTELIVWGGADGSNGYYYRVGGRYNPSTDTWQATPVVHAPSARVSHTGIWTGTDMIVWGGNDVLLTSFNTGGRYRPQ